jgi:hypothetical protein
MPKKKKSSQRFHGPLILEVDCAPSRKKKSRKKSRKKASPAQLAARAAFTKMVKSGGYGKKKKRSKKVGKKKSSKKKRSKKVYKRTADMPAQMIAMRALKGSTLPTSVRKALKARIMSVIKKQRAAC